MSEWVKQTLEGSALSGLLHVPSDSICDGGEERQKQNIFKPFWGTSTNINSFEIDNTAYF
jgi:hypothetical protein